jgi:hypothetical protein
MANIYVGAIATWNGKALTKGQKQLTAFEKSVKSLGRTLGVSLGAAALVQYGKKAVDAFTQDEAAAKSLEQQLKNTGYAFSSPDVEYYIANLQKMTGVLDDQLRPAFQTLLTASGSLTKSQQALALALDVSAATGKSVEEVSMALAKGFSGQTTALSRLGAGIDKATLASGDMNKIMDELQRKFSGQAKARLETYAGKMDLLRVSSANVAETIGKGLLDALSAIGKDKNLENITNGMQNLATEIANVIAGLGVVIGKFTSIAQNSGFLNFVGKLIEFNNKSGILGLLANAGAKSNAPSSNFTYGLGANAGVELAKIQELKARKSLVVTLKAEADLKKLQDKYNVERIGLMAALNAATDDETKQRLAEKLAILDGNAALAQKYLADRAAADSAFNFADKANEASTAIGKTASALTNTLLPALFTAAGEMTARAGRVLPSLADTNTSVSTGSAGSTSVNTTVTVNPPGGGTNNPSAQDIEDTVQNALLSLYRQGRNVVPAGSL